MQLDLFSWQPPNRSEPAVVICLPTWIQREARDAAERLFAQPADQWETRLRSEDTRFYKRLVDRGVRRATAHRAAMAFIAATRRALQRQRGVGRPQDGAA